MPISTGIDRETGLPLSDLAHVRQSFRAIVSTHFGTRVMRRTFGSGVPGLFGRNLVPATLAVFYQAVSLAVYLWEPRLRILQMLYPAPPNTPTMMRLDGIAVAILAEYRPYALTGDTTTGVQQIYLY